MSTIVYGPEPTENHPSPGTHIWGWMSSAELDWLHEQAAQMASIVEIGSLHGRSAYALLDACDGPVYCIDPWDDVHRRCLPSFMGNVGHFPNLRPIQALSPAAAEQVPGVVDMVFIDGDHEYESVIADIEAWLPKCGRLICGHDYQNADGGYPGVSQAAHEVFGDRVTNPAGAIWAVDL